MTNWSSGYVSDIGYTYGYYTELNPLRVKLAFLNSGLVYPEVKTACELGFGQGISTNIHAAATSTQWYGTDFNPSQAGFAQELSTISGNNAQLWDEGFVDFTKRENLPEFDFIGLHGIWSWISEENMGIIVDFIRRRLKVGGVLYISYNTLPGWAAFGPMRQLMTDHAEIIGAEGRGIVSRIDDAIEFAQQLLATNPIFAKANPFVSGKLKQLSEQNRHYLAHEYFNKDWHPMHFSTMAQWLEPAKVQYVCSANYLDSLDHINLTPEQGEFLKNIPDAMFRESVRDFMINQQFRRDYWVKGARRLSPLEKTEKIRNQTVGLIKFRSDVSLKIKGTLGEADMSPEIYNPILDLMSDYKARSLDQIERQVVKYKPLTFSQIKEAVLVLIGGGYIEPMQDQYSDISKIKSKTDRLNHYLIEKARYAGDINWLASPITGGGIGVKRFHQLFLLAMKQENSAQPANWADFAWNILQSQGQKLVKEGKPLETETESLEELTRHALEFQEKTLPVFKALKITS